MNHKYARLLYGEALDRLQQLTVLVVGVGGIGCEVLKCFSRLPVKQLDVVDLDTIQTSNFNRQFLFRKQHTGHSKALTAKQSLLQMNPSIPINAHHCAIQEKTVDFFRQFKLVVLALDNFQARTYVNQVCVVLQIPLVDAGTTGYLGQVQFTHPYHTACYTCENIENKKETVYAVCTIRRRPEKPIHCIVWAKFVFEMLFGPPNENNEMTDLQGYAKQIRKPTENTINSLAKFLFYDNVVDRMSSAQEGQIDIIDEKQLMESSSKEIENYIENLNASDLSEVPTLNKCIDLFKQSLIRLMKRLDNGNVLTFEKDDEIIMAFVTSAANIRMLTYRIKPLSYYTIKGMAGNIIPAIASTNSIVSGLQISESYKFFAGEITKMRKIWVQNQDIKLATEKVVKPRPNCGICSPSFKPVLVQCDFHKATINDIVHIIRTNRPQLKQFSINDDAKNEVYNSAEESESKILERPFADWTKNKIVQLTLMNDDTFETICGIFVADSTENRTSNLDMLQQQNMFVKPANLSKKDEEANFNIKQVNGKVQFELEDSSVDQSDSLQEITVVESKPKRQNELTVIAIEQECMIDKKKLKTD